jgi:hypothetical protein
MVLLGVLMALNWIYPAKHPKIESVGDGGQSADEENASPAEPLASLPPPQREDYMRKATVGGLRRLGFDLDPKDGQLRHDLSPDEKVRVTKPIDCDRLFALVGISADPNSPSGAALLWEERLLQLDFEGYFTFGPDASILELRPRWVWTRGGLFSADDFVWRPEESDSETIVQLSPAKDRNGLAPLGTKAIDASLLVAPAVEATVSGPLAKIMNGPDVARVMVAGQWEPESVAAWISSERYWLAALGMAWTRISDLDLESLDHPDSRELLSPAGYIEFGGPEDLPTTGGSPGGTDMQGWIVVHRQKSPGGLWDTIWKVPYDSLGDRLLPALPYGTYGLDLYVPTQGALARTFRAGPVHLSADSPTAFAWFERSLRDPESFGRFSATITVPEGLPLPTQTDLNSSRVRRVDASWDSPQINPIILPAQHRRFEVSGMAPPGKYELAMRWAGVRFDFELDEREVKDFGELHAGVAQARFRIIDQGSGALLPEAVVGVHQSDSTTLQGKGNLEQEFILAAGLVDLRVEVPGYRPLWLECSTPPGQSEVTVVFLPERVAEVQIDVGLRLDLQGVRRARFFDGEGRPWNGQWRVSSFDSNGSALRLDFEFKSIPEDPALPMHMLILPGLPGAGTGGLYLITPPSSGVPGRIMLCV